MGWRETFLAHFGPGLLGGITLGDWLRLLRERRFAISPSCLPRAISITVQSVRNSFLRELERRRFAPKLRGLTVQRNVSTTLRHLVHEFTVATLPSSLWTAS